MPILTENKKTLKNYIFEKENIKVKNDQELKELLERFNPEIKGDTVYLEVTYNMPFLLLLKYCNVLIDFYPSKKIKIDSNFNFKSKNFKFSKFKNLNEFLNYLEIPFQYFYTTSLWYCLKGDLVQNSNELLSNINKFININKSFFDFETVFSAKGYTFVFIYNYPDSIKKYFSIFEVFARLNKSITNSSFKNKKLKFDLDKINHLEKTVINPSSKKHLLELRKLFEQGINYIKIPFWRTDIQNIYQYLSLKDTYLVISKKVYNFNSTRLFFLEKEIKICNALYYMGFKEVYKSGFITLKTKEILNEKGIEDIYFVKNNQSKNEEYFTENFIAILVHHILNSEDTFLNFFNISSNYDEIILNISLPINEIKSTQLFSLIKGILIKQSISLINSTKYYFEKYVIFSYHIK